MVPADNDQELIEVAYELTHGLANQMLGKKFDFCFNEGFSFIVALSSSHDQWYLRTVTSGNVLEMLVNNKVESMEKWMELATVDLQKGDD